MRAMKGMHKFAESEKDAMTMLMNYCPENFYKGAIRCCEMKELEMYPKWQCCIMCWLQDVSDFELEAT